MVKFSKMNLRILLYLRWSSLQKLVLEGPTMNGQYLHIAVVTRPCLMAKLKSDKNGYALNAASDKLSCFVDMLSLFFFFFENANYFLFHKHSVSFQKLITKMKTDIIVDLIFQGFINRSNHQHMCRKNVVNKMQEKHL